MQHQLWDPFLCSFCPTRSLRAPCVTCGLTHTWFVQITEAERSMNIKLRYTGEEFVDVKAW